MQKITPHLWFDTKAKEAAQLYTSAFENSKIISSTSIHDTPSGTADIITIALAGQEFMLLNAGPNFQFNPSVSFSVACSSKEEVDQLWKKLSPGGMVYMELGAYPFSPWYGWTTDRFGLSWQIMQSEALVKQKITPSLLFVGDVVGKTEEAIHFYTSIFHTSSIDHMMRYEEGEEPDTKGTIKHAGFTLAGQDFAAMDSARMHDFQFSEAISFIVNCDTQDEIDYYWDKLSAVKESEQCGWLKDKYGLSWQISPVLMNEMFEKGSPEQIERVTKAFLQMKKFDIAALKKAYENA